MAGHPIVPKCAGAGNPPRQHQTITCRVSPRKSDLKINTHKQESLMGIVSVFYAAFGYLALLAAILWGMLFVADGTVFPNMDAVGSAVPLKGTFVDLGLLLLLALLHRSMSRGMLRHVARRLIPRDLERSTQAWAAAAALALIYAGWQPLPQLLWNATGPLQWVLSGLSYLAWTLILIGAFLVSHLDMFEIAEVTGVAPSGAADDLEHARATGKAPLTGTLRQPLNCGILIAVWATSRMTVGHLLLAATVTAYLLFDGLWRARSTAEGRPPRPAFSFEGKRLAR
jgi:methanethiol S-methyltransferase